jgi:site-specific DNA-methyltransferase (adenine-specific)
MSDLNLKEMDLLKDNLEINKMSKKELLEKCEKLGIVKCKSKSKEELRLLIDSNSNKCINKIKLIIEDDDEDNNENIKIETTCQNASNELIKNEIIVPKNSKEELKKKKQELLEQIETQTTENFINDNVTLYFGDCIIEMSKIKDDSVDLILCDLPYGTTKCKWDTIIDLTKLWEHYKRIIKKPSGVILLFGQQPFTSMLVSSNYEWFKYNLIWKKNKTTQFLLANYRPMKCTEDICVFSKGGAAAASKTTGNMTYNPQGLIPTNIKKKNSKERIGKMLNQEHHLGKNNKLISDSEYTQNFTNYPNELIEFDIEFDTIHETQKPVKLIEYLIKTYSNENGVVLDNTMGSGTTGVGCLNTNRKFIGIEKEEKYYKLSKQRIIGHL